MTTKKTAEPTRLADLKAAGYNPRTITPEALSGLGYSMAEFGDISGIVLNSRTGRLVAGHQRVKSLRERYGDLAIEDGMIRTPEGHAFRVRVVDWPESKERAANIAANSPTIAGDFTEDLDDLLRQIAGEEPEIMAELHLDELLRDIEPPDFGEIGDAPEPKDDQAVELRKKWGTEPGQLWLIPSNTVPGKAHRLLCGDSTVADDVVRLMDGERAVLFATDPPYLVDYDGTNHPSKKNGWADDRQRKGGKLWDKNKDWSASYRDFDGSEQGIALYDGFVEMAVEHAIVENAAWYCWHASRRQAMLEDCWERHGAFVHQQIIWAKDRGVLTRSWYLWGHEPCFMGWVRGNKPPRRSDDYPSTVWTIPTIRPGTETLHPTSKPIEVFAIPMKQHTRPGEVCYEPFSGSGSQHVAGEQLGRLVFGMEKAPEFVAVILERLSEMGLEPARERS